MVPEAFAYLDMGGEALPDKIEDRFLKIRVYLKLRFNWVSCICMCQIWQAEDGGYMSARPVLLNLG